MTDLISSLTQALSAPESDRLAAVDALWASLAHDDHAGRCIVAHYAADLQPSLADEIAWDERCYAEFAHVTEESLQAVHPALTVDGFRPSLQLNLADGYRRQGRFADAIAALELGREHLDVFDGAPAEQQAYAATILDGYARVSALIGERSTAPSRPTT